VSARTPGPATPGDPAPPGGAGLRRRLEFAELVINVSQRFIDVAPGALDAALDTSLQDLAAFSGADRAYLFAVDLGRRLEWNTHEWCAAGVAPTLQLNQRLAIDANPWVLHRLEALEPVRLHDIAVHAGLSIPERTTFLSRGIASLACVPIHDHGRLIAYLGFDAVRAAVRWSDEDIDLMTSVSGLFAQVFARREADIARRRALQRARLAFAGAPVAMTVTDLYGTLVDVNEAACGLLGRTRSELVGSHVAELTHPDDLAATLAVVERLANGSARDAVVEKRYRRPDTTTFWASTRLRVTRDDHGDPLIVGALTETTQRRLAEERLRQAEQRLQALVDNLPDPVIRAGLDGRPLFSNKAATAVVGMDREAAARVRSSTAFGIPRDLRDQWLDAVARVVATREPDSLECSFPTRAGNRFYAIRLVPEFAPDGEVESVLSVARDLTDRRRAEAELEHQALHDPLTGLPNRKLLLRHLETALATAAPGRQVGMLFLDLDRFKVINDSVGHGHGDAYLTTVAERLLGAARPLESVARLGGDEFTVLLSDVADETAAIEAVTRFQAALAEPIAVGGVDMAAQASIGVAVTSDPATPPLDLLRRADAAMYQAKERGRNRFEVFDDRLQSRVRDRLTLESDLRKALERGELTVHYQPEVDMRTGEVVAAEALARWEHPERGLLAAASFIGIAEDSGLVVPLGTFVLGEACRQAVAWNRHRPNRPLIARVNLSARQLARPDLIALVQDHLDGAGLAPELLCLEITETALMADPETGLGILRGLDEIGVQLAVDDFGIGYSSLAYLKQFPVDVLKIDRSFVAGLPDDHDDVAIVTTIIRLAEAMGLTVTAEGIETWPQVAALVAMGCQHGQGYFFAQPAPPGALPPTALRSGAGSSWGTARPAMATMALTARDGRPAGRPLSE